MEQPGTIIATAWNAVDGGGLFRMTLFKNFINT